MTRPDAETLERMVAWRHHLHTMPELSGAEQGTAAEVIRLLEDCDASEIVTGLGGHGVAAIFSGIAPGPTVMLRAELDALPIVETGTPSYRSRVEGHGHLCGHDGHMAILGAVAMTLARRRPQQGRAILLFQPAEETGAGAAAVLADPRFGELRPDWVFALHNLPGVPLGAAWLRPGVVNCASRGMAVRLTGRTAHASMPETGVSPAGAIAELVPALTALGHGRQSDPDFALVTVTHLRVGEPTFGVAPGEAHLFVTLRTLTDAGMASLVAEAETIMRDAAAKAGLGVEVTCHDVFAHCENDPAATGALARALDAEGIPRDSGNLPMRASEDFGRFAHGSRAAMVFLGAGETHPQLHNPDYDFPDVLIAPGAAMFLRVLDDCLDLAAVSSA